MMLILDSEWNVAKLGAVPPGFVWPRFQGTFFWDAVDILPQAAGIALSASAVRW